MPAVFTAALTAVLPHIFVQVWWMKLVFAVSWGASLLVHLGLVALPAKIVRNIITILCAAALLIIFGGVFRDDTGIGLLIVMAGLKMLEARSSRDRMILVLLCYFMATTSLFVSDSILMTFYMFFSVLVTTVVLIELNSENMKWAAKLKTALTLLGQALPLFLVLFLFFPRFHDNLWGVRKKIIAVTGLSEELSPGSIAKLSKNTKVAFRVKFIDNLPKAENLYWRTLVLYQFDGETWMHGPGKWHYPERLMLTGNPLSYEITAEPHGKRWLFALDMPVESNVYGIISADYTIRSFGFLNKRKRYNVKSYLEYTAPLSRDQQGKSDELPQHGNDRAKELALGWAQQSVSYEQVVELGKQFFLNNKFTYTNEPPLLGSDKIDDFLFRTKSGYCEHFSSSFAFLMRAAGIPARIVVGYLGGEYNPYGDYFIVRQSDAHSWVEVFLDKKGWSRVDPTLLVSPERFRLSFVYELDQNQISSDSFLGQAGQVKLFLKPLMLRWDQLNIYWNTWVMGYTYTFQDDLLGLLGLSRGSMFLRFKGLLILLSAIVIVFIGSYMLIKKIKAQTCDPVQTYYLIFCDKMLKIGIKRHPAWGPVTFSKKLIEKRADLAEDIMRITDLYIKLRYRSKDKTEGCEDFVRLVRKFKP